jgi:hypothetical protein
MSFEFKYRGRVVTDADLDFIRELIARNPAASRRALSRKLCEAWNWVQPNGALRDMVCRGLMLELHRAGHLKLPAHRKFPHNPLAVRKRPAPVHVDRTPIRGHLQALGALAFRQVRRDKEEGTFNGLIQEHHYLGYTQPVGEHLKYMVYAGERPVACLALSSAPRHLGPRDRFIGWDAQARRRNIRFVAYNSRYLILPWVEVPHLASHILGRLARRLPNDWHELYGHPVYFLETFVDPQLYRGTCYRAANWLFLGHTTGRGKNDQTNKANRSLKEVLGYPLSKRFRELLGGEL